jgi:hypothetical protein
MATFQETLTAAINDLLEHGFDSEERVARWQELLREAAHMSLRPTAALNEMVAQSLRAAFRRMVDHYGVLKYHPGIQRFTLDSIKPRLRAELDRRIMASANLIKLNREESISKTLRRFSGWATSIPAGGSDQAVRQETKTQVRKALASLPFEERRVIIDQGHKLNAAINDIIARDNNALAVIWHSHWRQSGYNYREDHKERDLHVYAIRGNWAMERGLMKAGPDGYYDEIDGVGDAVFCRCYAEYIYSVGGLPADMLTRKGLDELRRIRGRIQQ